MARIKPSAVEVLIKTFILISRRSKISYAESFSYPLHRIRRSVFSLGCLGNETSATGRLFRGCWNNLKFPAARDSARAESFRRGSDPRLSVFGRRLGARHGRVGSVAGAPPRRDAATNSSSAVSSY